MKALCLTCPFLSTADMGRMAHAHAACLCGSCGPGDTTRRPPSPMWLDSAHCFACTTVLVGSLQLPEAGEASLKSFFNAGSQALL